LANNGARLLVDIYDDEEPDPFKANILCEPDSDSTKSREWISIVVDNEADFHTFVMKQESPSVQVRIISIRIHASPGGLTSG